MEMEMSSNKETTIMRISRVWTAIEHICKAAGIGISDIPPSYIGLALRTGRVVPIVRYAERCGLSHKASHIRELLKNSELYGVSDDISEQNKFEIAFTKPQVNGLF